jgi:stringent starvation protein B
MNSPPIAPLTAGTSTRPYLIRALHDWCTDNGFTPYIAVLVDEQVRVPMEYVKNNEIVLNVGFEATTSLKLGNEAIEFKARFGGVSREIVVPVDHVIAIYARENGQGMAFPSPQHGEGPSKTPNVAGTAAAPQPRARGPRLASSEGKSGDGMRHDQPGQNDPTEPPGGPRPSLKRIK